MGVLSDSSVPQLLDLTETEQQQENDVSPSVALFNRHRYLFLLLLRLVGRFLALSPEFCFVVEDEQGVCGYALGARDAKEFLACSQSSWVQAMCEKYPKPLKDDLSPAEVLHLKNEKSMFIY